MGREEASITSSSSSSSDEDTRHRKSRGSRTLGKRERREGREEREKRKGRRRKDKGDEGRRKKRSKSEEKGDKARDRKKRRKRKSEASASDSGKDEASIQFRPKTQAQLEAVTEAAKHRKAIIWQNVEMAKARLASGELQRKKHEQSEMQRLYGTVDWREKKKLRSEKRRLERTIATGEKLASLEEREHARMDAFRIALGLPTVEAQRQAEWRAEATRALAEAEALTKDVLTTCNGVSSKSSKQGIIGPRLPR